MVAADIPATRTPEGRTRVTVAPMLERAAEPITSIPQTYNRKVSESVERMGSGWDQFMTAIGKQPMEKWEATKGVGNMAAGAIDYTMAPIHAPVETIAGKPLQENLGIPKEYTEFAVDLLIPGIGLTKTKQGAEIVGGVKNAGKTAEKIFSPDTVSSLGEAAGGQIRAETGRAAQATAQTAHELEGFRKQINQLDAPSRFELINYVEGRSAGAQLRDPRLQQVADTMRTAFEERRTALQAMPQTSQATFIQDYFPHLWQDPKAAANFVKGFGTKEGSGRNLKARSIPTVADGIAVGLKPVTTDPIAATLKYVENMDRFIATNRVFDTAVNVGAVKKYARGKQPDGWVEVNTARGSPVMPYYAPQDWARVYNNFISKGVHGMGQGEYGATYDVLRRGANSVTALELGLSGYHTLTMAQEAVVNSVAKALDMTIKGQFKEAGKALAGAAVAPVSLAFKGGKRGVEGVYLGAGTNDPMMKRVVELLTLAGGRGKGSGHALDYEFSRKGSYVTAFQQARLKAELISDIKDIRDKPIINTAKQVANHIGRTMQTVAQPLFDKYIPKMKNGAFYENMSGWLKAHPNATADEQVKAARNIWDSVDNRFGEMVQDNIFWDKTMKQAALLSLRSFSWTLGGPIREIGGGIRDIGRSATGKEWTSKASYAVALPFTFGTLNAVYQFMKTGESPQGMQDLLAPRTGGTDARTGHPERIMMPGYMKDVFGFALHPVQEAKNKIATAPRLVGETLSLSDGKGGTNWRGDPIISPPREGEQNAPRWLKEYLAYLLENLGPISLRNAAKGAKEGSNLGSIEQVLGTKTAPTYLTDPEGNKTMMKNLRQRGWQKKERFDRRQKSLYGGSDD